MHLSKLFIPISKDLPAEAKIKSHQLMLQAGMIKQSSAGIYSWLPLGFKVMKKIEQIVRKFLITTIITSIIFIVIYYLVQFDLLNLRKYLQ